MWIFLASFGVSLGLYWVASHFASINPLILIVAAIIFFIFFQRFLKAMAGRGEGDMLPEDVKAKEAYKQGVARLRKIRGMTQQIKKNEVAEKIQEICRIGYDIFDNLKDHPEDLSRSKTFINYYVDTTEKIVTRYVELSRRADISEEIQQSLLKTEESLDALKETYSKQLSAVLENDVLDLETEIKVLENMIKFES